LDLGLIIEKFLLPLLPDGRKFGQITQNRPPKMSIAEKNWWPEKRKRGQKI
jgi:hypothetical protein